MSEIYPNSSIYWASYNSLIHILILLLKQIYSILAPIAMNWNFERQSTIAIALFILLIICIRWREGGEQRFLSNIFSVFQELLTFTTCSGAFLAFLVDDYIEFFYYSIIASVPLTFLYVILQRLNEESIMKTLLPYQQKTATDIAIYIYNFLIYLEKPSIRENYVRLTVILDLHSQQCDNPSCICSKVKEFVAKQSNINKYT